MNQIPLQSLGVEISRATSSQSSSRESKFPSHARAYLHFLFDINLTRIDIILFTQFWSNIFFSNNDLLYGRALCFFESLRPISINASGGKKELLLEIHWTIIVFIEHVNRNLISLKHQHISPKWKCHPVEGKLIEVIPGWGCPSVADFLLSTPEVLSSIPRPQTVTPGLQGSVNKS